MTPIEQFAKLLQTDPNTYLKVSAANLRAACEQLPDDDVARSLLPIAVRQQDQSISKVVLVPRQHLEHLVKRATPAGPA